MRHNWLSSTRICFSPDDGSGGGVATPSAPAPSGDAGDGSSVAAPASVEDGGAASVPSSTPDPGGEAPSDSNLWDALGSADDLDTLEVQPDAPTPTPLVVPPVPPVAPTPQPATPTPAPAQPAPAQTPPAPQTPASAAPPSPSDPVGLANAMEANRNDIIAHLATSKFALTPEEVTALESDVVTAVPMVMSRVFLEAQMSTMKFLAQAVPGMMKQYNTVTKANDDAEGEFFKAHPTLDKANPAHRATAVRLATLYRAANPTVPLKQLIAEIGPMVIAAVGMNGTTPAAAAPVTPRGGTPFRPAVNGGGGSSPAPAVPDEWAGLGQTFDEG